MHILLSVLGWTLLALLALLVLILVLPVRAELEYREGALSVRVRVFGLSFQGVPLFEKIKKLWPKKKKPKKTNQPAVQSPPKEKKKTSGIELADIRNILGAAGTFVQYMCRKIQIRDVILIVPIHREDAAQTALACGRGEAWLGGLAALLQNYFDLRIVQVRVLPDFTNEITAGVYLSCSIGARPIALLAAGIHALVYMVRQMPPKPKKPAPKGQKEKPSAPAAGK